MAGTPLGLRSGDVHAKHGVFRIWLALGNEGSLSQGGLTWRLPPADHKTIPSPVAVSRGTAIPERVAHATSCSRRSWAVADPAPDCLDNAPAALRSDGAPPPASRETLHGRSIRQQTDTVDAWRPSGHRGRGDRAARKAMTSRSAAICTPGSGPGCSSWRLGTRCCTSSGTSHV